MMFEIRGVGFTNKGAELMLHAVMQRVSKEWPDADFVMEPRSIFAPYLERAKVGLYQKASYFENFNQLDQLEVPENARKMYGIVLDSEIDAVLDASGLAYSDQMGEAKSICLAKLAKQWHQQGTKVVLLPQAFGPFSSTEIKDSMKVVADFVDLIFARDKESYTYLTDVVGERNNIRIAPDFTNLIEGIFPDKLSHIKNRVCIVPNVKMIISSSPETSAVYVPFLTSCIKVLKSKGKNPFILVHCKDDLDLAELIASGFKERIEIIFESNPLVIKGILGNCSAAIGSRFHGLVSALSQGVPSLATGWSHKYKMLFEEYDFESGVINSMTDTTETQLKISEITEKNSTQMIRNKLTKRSKHFKKTSESMWQDVFRIIKS